MVITFIFFSSNLLVIWIGEEKEKDIRKKNINYYYKNDFVKNRVTFVIWLIIIYVFEGWKDEYIKLLEIWKLNGKGLIVSL